MDKLTQIKTFFSRPGINKEGILKEAGIQTRLMNLVLSGERKLTDKTIDKLWPVMERYGPNGSDLKYQLDKLTDDQRKDLFDNYCKFCGNPNLPCYCERDD